LLRTAFAAAFLLANIAGTVCDLSCAWQSQASLAFGQAANHDACCDHSSSAPPGRHHQHKNSSQDCPSANSARMTAVPSLGPSAAAANSATLSHSVMPGDSSDEMRWPVASRTVESSAPSLRISLPLRV
jgi:hypothetical protein